MSQQARVVLAFEKRYGDFLYNVKKTINNILKVNAIMKIIKLSYRNVKRISKLINL